MNTRKLIAAGAAVTVCCLALNLRADDWPGWRGPQRTGISAETGLLKEWSSEGPKLVWQAHDLGEGYSTPAVVGDRIYLVSNKGTDDEFVQSLATADATKVWSTRIGKVGPNKGQQYPGARSTPTLDGELLYALGSDGNLVCLETKTGSLRWEKNLRTDFGGQPGNWAYSESPLVDGDLVVCTPGGADATILALDKRTGDVVWKAALEEADQAAYASMIIVEVGGIKQYVQFVQKGLVGVDAKTGNFLWRYARTAEGSPANIPTPIASGPYIYSAAGRSGGGLVELKVDGGNVTADQIYFQPKMPTAIGGAVELKGFLYGTNTAGLMCVDFKTGETKWQERGVGAGSICAAEGLLYIHGEKGDVALVEASSEAYREKGRFTLPDQPERGRSQAWAYPIIANGRLYIHDLGEMWCYDIARK